MPALSASANLGAVTYSAGDAFSFAPSAANPLVRLTIDAQVPDDVTKVEGTLLGTVALSANSELYVVNTSTTVPLIVKLLDNTKDITASGRLAKLKVRGDYINIGTGTGANDQTVSTVIAGKSIDWPPFVEVETAAGSGVYVSMLNITGDYQNDGSVVPAQKLIFANVGTTPELGCFFEYDELNRTIHFGNATGGWIPPNGANIRIPNIHFTSGGLPQAVLTNRSLIPNGGTLDLQTCSFSNRFVATFGSPSKVTSVNCGMPCNANATGVKEALYMRNVNVALEAYVAGAACVYASTSGMDVDGWKRIMNGNATQPLQMAPYGVAKNVSVYHFNRSATSTDTVTLAHDVTDATPKRVENLLVAGGRLTIANINNLVVKGFYPSDTVNSTKVSTVAMQALQFSANVVNSVVQTVRIPTGGTPSYTRFLLTNAQSVRGCAVHDIIYDGAAHTDNIIQSASANRLWIANATLSNPRNKTFFDNSPNGFGIPPVRALNIGGTVATAIDGLPGGAMVMVKSGTTALISNANGLSDVDLLHTTYTTPTTGVLTLMLGSLKNLSQRYEVVSGADGVDYWFSSNQFASLTASCEVIFSSNLPARGITSFTGCALSGSVAGANTFFKMRSANQGQDWPAAWTAWSATDLTTAFDALVDYDSTDGFDLQFRVVGTGASSTGVGSIGVTGLTVDAAFAPFDVGYVEVAVLGGENGAVVGIVDTASGDVLRAFETLGASGAMVIDYPYNYDNGIARPYRLVSRKVGYLESVTTNTVDQTGATVPVPLVAAHSCASAAVAGVTINGAAKTISVSSGLDFLDVYQHAQWWATQRANIVYATPMTSENGEVFEVPMDHKLSWPTMGMDGTLSGGWLLLAAAGTHTYALTGTKIEFQAAGSYNMSGTIFGGTVELVNTSGGAVTVSVPSGTAYTNTGPSITVTAPTTNQSVTVNGLVAGSRIQIYDVTSATELYNGVVAGTSYTWTDPATPTASRDIRLRAAYAAGAGARQFVDAAIGTCGVTTGDAAVTYLINQLVDTIYGDNAVDGSTVTGITIVDALDLMQINIAGGTVSWKDIYAYNVYWLTTSAGIADDGSIITAKDAANYTLTLFKIKNTSATPLKITGGYGIDSVTGSVADILDTTGGSIFPVVDHVVSSVVTVTGGNVITGDIADVIAAVPPAVVSALQDTTIPVDIQKVHGTQVNGSGTQGDPWGP